MMRRSSPDGLHGIVVVSERQLGSMGVAALLAAALLAGCFRVYLDEVRQPQRVTVVSPNGGERWYAGETHGVTWTSTGVGGGVDLHYSTDGGGSWTAIVLNAPNDGAHTWTVSPYANGTRCRVRVREAGGGGLSDVSDASFTIAAASITVLSPNGGETLTAGAAETITWTSVRVTGDVEIRYSTDGGATYPPANLVATVPAAGGAYGWIIPSDPSTRCRIRVRKLGGGAGDESDADLAIVPGGSGGGAPVLWVFDNSDPDYSNPPFEDELACFNSSGQELWSLPQFNICQNIGGNHMVAADAAPGYCWVVENVADRLSKIDHLGNVEVQTSVPDATAVAVRPDGPTVYVAYGTTTTGTGINAYDASGNLVNSTTSAHGFDIVVSPFDDSLVVVGKYAYKVRPDLSVVWSETGLFVWCAVSVDTRGSDGTIWIAERRHSQVAGSANRVHRLSAGGALLDTIPLAQSPRCVVVDQADGSCYVGLYAVTKHYDRSGNPLADIPCGAWSLAVDADGAVWCAPRFEGKIFKYASDGALLGSSPEVFSTDQKRIALVRGNPVVPAITVTSPNGGEVLHPGETCDVTWTSSSVAGNVEIRYSTDGGATYPAADLIATVPASDGSYTWTVPNTPGTNCLVRVQEVGGGAGDESNSPFSIAPRPTITVTTPNGGETWRVGETHSITWTAVGFTGDVWLFYSPDGGSSTSPSCTYVHIDTVPAADGSYAWTVPDRQSTRCRVRVQEATGLVGGMVGDESDADFTIAPAASTTPPASPTFTDIGAGLRGVYRGCLAWADFDNDGDLDLTLAGEGSPSEGAQRITTIYRNNAGTFADAGAGLPGMIDGSVAWGDFDNDGDLDLAWSRFAVGVGGDSRIYRNDGGTLVDIGAGLMGVYFSFLAWGDYDNDGDLDLALAGEYWDGSDYVSTSKIYRNDGGGVFTDIGAGLTGVRSCSLAWGDYDNDGDLDLALAGYYVRWASVSKVYRNDGGTFTDICAGLTSVSNCSLAWGDYDNDGDLDLALAGSGVSKVYRNDGGTFTDIGAGLTGVSQCSLAWGDCDNDGDLDLALAGYSSTQGRASKVYRNDGGGTFTDIAAGLTGFDYASLAWGDYDNDGDLDLALAGGWYDGSWHYESKVYRNDGGTFNTTPSAPTGLGASYVAAATDYDVTFSWAAPAVADETPDEGLSYNLRVGTTSGGDEVFSGMADVATGWRRLPARGAVQPGSSMSDWTLNLPAGTYYWSVQAVDTALAGGVWAAEETVTVGAPSSRPPVPAPASITVSSPNGGETLVVGDSHEITWTGAGAKRTVKLYYSVDDGLSWKRIAAGEANDGSFAWTVPDEKSSLCLVRVAESGGGLSDASDATFTITPPMITVTFPNGGESLTIGATETITWTSVGVTANVDIHYSTDGGSTWTSLATNVANTGSYAWTVPDEESGLCLVRVEETGGTGLSDESDAFFAIAPAPAPRALVINEIDPGCAEDWVELYNPGGHAVELAGWSLQMAGPCGSSTYFFPSFSLPAGGYLVVHEYSGTDTATDLYAGENIWFTACEGHCVLVDGSGEGVDFVRWGSSAQSPPAGTSWSGTDPVGPVEGMTLGRDQWSTDTDRGADWENTCGADSDAPTPGAANGTALPGPDLIVESMTHAPWNPEPGVDVTFAVTVRNRGNARAGLFSVGFWSDRAAAPSISEAPEASLDVLGLAAGASTTVDFAVRAPSDGSYQAWAYADCNGEVNESFETNNAGPPAGHAWAVCTGSTLFSEDFEDGDYAGWTAGTGSYARNVTTLTAAGGSHSFTLIGGGTCSHYDGVSHALADLRPSRVNFYVRSSDATTADGYFVVGTGPSVSQTAVFFHFGREGTMYVYSGSAKHGEVPYVADRWYLVSFVFDWAGRRIDFYVDGVLAEGGIPFRATSVDRLSAVYLYNFDSSQAWWDEIEFLP